MQKLFSPFGETYDRIDEAKYVDSTDNATKLTL